MVVYNVVAYFILADKNIVLITNLKVENNVLNFINHTIPLKTMLPILLSICHT